MATDLTDFDRHRHRLGQARLQPDWKSDQPSVLTLPAPAQLLPPTRSAPHVCKR